MNILVTGGAGFIGSHLVDRLVEKNNVIVVDNVSRDADHNLNTKAYTYYYSITEPELEKVFIANDIDVVVHLAAQVDAMYSMDHVRDDVQVNVLGMVNLMELSKKYNVKRFVLASSAAIYGDNPNVPLSETEIPKPINPYGLDKMIGEQYCSFFNEMFGLSTIALRFSNVYGPRQSYVGEGGVISIFLAKACRGEQLTVYGDGLQTRDFIYVEDVVDGIVAAMGSQVNGNYNIATGEYVSLNDLITLLESLEEVQVDYKDGKKGDIKHSALNPSKAEKDLEFTAKTMFSEGIKRTHTWYKQLMSQQED